MADHWLVCTRCGSEFARGPYFLGCPNCAAQGPGAALEVRYDFSAAKRKLVGGSHEDGRSGLLRFSPLLPFRYPDRAITLGEGGTPLISLPRLNDALGLHNLTLKNESQNPTWSFKDRFNAVTVSVAREMGFVKIASSSTGNHGASASAYAAAAGMRCAVFLPDETPELLRDLIQAYGAQAIVTRWQARGQLLEKLVRDHGWFPASTLAPMPVGSPYGIEGYKTIAFEMILASRHAPLEVIFVPVGGSDGLYGIFKGWREFLEIGLTEQLPKFVACQASGANPVVRAVVAGERTVTPIEDARSIATSAREATAGAHALSAIYESGGFAIEVSDTEIRDAMKLLARHGIAAEAASALSVAGAKKALAHNLISDKANVAALLTSTLIKWPGHLAELGTRSATISASFEDLCNVLVVE